MEKNHKNKLIITTEEEYIVSSLFHHGEMIEVDLYPLNEEESILGNIYVGKVQNIVKNINAAFVEIADGIICYLSLKKGLKPIFTSNSSSDTSIADNRNNNTNIVIGDELLVQVSKEQIKTKAPVVSTELNFTGKYVVLIAGKTSPSISSKIQDKKKREELKELLNKYTRDDYSFIARTNSAFVSDDRIIQEINILIEKYNEVKQYGIYRSPFSLIYKTPPGYICDIRDSYDRNLGEIVTDDSIIYSKIENYIKEYQAEDSYKLRLYEDSQICLRDLYSLKSKLNNLLKEKVWLKSGGSIIIQHTEALTVIDVNTAKAVKGNKKNPEQNYFKVNMEAAKEIAKQIRLRNISGIIIIDFIDMKEQDHKDALMKELEALFIKDPIKTILIDMTALNLVEVTRKKIRKPLYEQLAIAVKR